MSSVNNITNTTNTKVPPVKTRPIKFIKESATPRPTTTNKRSTTKSN